MLVDPLDTEAWASAVADLLDDPARRTLLSRHGVERSHHFRWPDAAAALADVYRAVGERPHHPITEEPG